METKLCLIFGRLLAPEKNGMRQNFFFPATQSGKNMHGIFLKDSTKAKNILRTNFLRHYFYFLLHIPMYMSKVAMEYSTG